MLERQMLELRDIPSRIAALGWGPEGERIVEVHKRIIALLDEMIEKKRGKRR